MGRPDPEFHTSPNRSTITPGCVAETTQATTKKDKVSDGISSSSVANPEVSYGEPPSPGGSCSSGSGSSSSRWLWCDLNGIEYVYVLIMVAAVLAIVVAISLVFALRGEDEVQYLPRNTKPPTPTFAPTPAPTPAPTRRRWTWTPTTRTPTTRTPTTLMPTRADLAFLPMDTQEAIRIAGIERIALEWVYSFYSEFSEYPEWKKQQLFALATFYYSMRGPEWRIPPNSDDATTTSWLDNTQSECHWYQSSTSNSSNNDHNGSNSSSSNRDYAFDSLPSCNDQGEYQAIRLQNVLSATTDRIALPRELAMLTSLKSIQISNDHHDGTYQSSGRRLHIAAPIDSLIDLNLANNDIHGWLPTEIGYLTSLRVLNLTSNKIHTLPSQLGLLTNLVYLGLSNNWIKKRSIPTQIGLLTSLKVFEWEWK